MQDCVSRMIIGTPAHGTIAEPNITAARAFRHSPTEAMYESSLYSPQ
jgi:hypothetical protein